MTLLPKWEPIGRVRAFKTGPFWPEKPNVIRFVALAALCVVAARPALAQNQFEGLDLSDDAPKKDAPKKDEPKKDEDLDLPVAKKKPPPSSEDAPRKPLAKTDEEKAGEQEIIQEDRVNSKQRKLYIKRGRVEIAPYFVININDPYHTRLGGAIRAAFYPADTLAAALRFTYLTTLQSDDARVARSTLLSRLFFSVPKWTLMGNLEWSAIYGKVAVGNSILHADGYVIGGAGVVYTETNGARSETPPINFAFDLGLGLRFVAKDFFAVNLALVNTAYHDVPTGTTKGALQNLMTVQIGFSLFIPFKSTFKDAE